ncbi:MAG TPA: glycosyltransferase [Acidimicrobiales bacterium]|nr:glycosyltransferase [Acidimicrobiales bacterium]
MPRIAVVIITRDRPDDLERSLQRLTALPEQPLIVVVDNCSTGNHLPVLRRDFPSVDFVSLPANGGAAARTVGVRWAESDYVAFADDDSWWEPGSLERAVDLMEADPRIGLVAARVVVEPSGRVDPTSAQMAEGPLGPDLLASSEGLRAVAGCMACGCVVRSRAYLSVGGFQPGMGVGGEEQMLVWDLWAAGWRALYASDVVAHHHPATSRDPSARRATVTRTDLWSTWARLPVRSALNRTASVLRAGSGDPRATARGAARAVRRADWALSRRARLPAEVDRLRRQLGG